MAKEILLERHYPHPIEKVWKAISDPDALSKWLMPTDFKLQKGHRFQFKAPPQPGFDGIVHCEVLDFEAPHYLVYTWDGGFKRPTQVRWDLESTPDGTRLKLLHNGFEGFNGWLVRFILNRGWKKLLSKALAQHLDS